MKKAAAVILTLTLFLPFAALAQAPEVKGISYLPAQSFANMPQGPVPVDGENICSYTVSQGMDNISSYAGGKLVISGPTPGVEFGCFGALPQEAAAAAPQYDGFCFYFENRDLVDVELGIGAQCMVNGQKNGYGLSPELERVLLISSAGTQYFLYVGANSRYDGQGTFIVPVSFEGFIYIPFSALYNQISGDKRPYDPHTDALISLGYVITGYTVMAAYGDIFWYKGELPVANPSLPPATATPAPSPAPTPEPKTVPLLNYLCVGTALLLLIGGGIWLVAALRKKEE